MNGSEEVGYEGFSYPNWNATAIEPTETTQSNNAPFHVVSPKSASSTSNTGLTSGIQYNNGVTTTTPTAASSSGITRVPSVGGSYFHQRSVSKNTFAPFISPTSASANVASTATAAPVSINTTNDNNINNNSVTIKNDCTNPFVTNVPSGNNNLVSNSQFVMNAGNSTSSHTITPLSSSVTSVDNTRRPSHPTNLFNSLDNNNNNSGSKNYMWRENDILPAKTKSPLPVSNQTPLIEQQQLQQRSSTPQMISSHVSIHQHHNSNTNSGSKHIFRQHDASHVTINDREVKSFVPFVQTSPAPQLTSSVNPTSQLPNNNVNESNNMPCYNSPNVNFNNNNNSSTNSTGTNGNRSGNTIAMTSFPLPPPPVDALATQPTSEVNVSTMNFFNRTSGQPLAASSPTITKPAVGGGVLFASSASSPFVQQSNDNNNMNGNNNNNTVSNYNSNGGYYVPSTDQQQQWNATSMSSSQNQLRHRKHKNENDNIKRSKWLMGTLLNRFLRRGDDLDSDESDEDNVNSENNDEDENDGYDSNNNNNNNYNMDGTINSRSNSNNQINRTFPLRPTLFQKESQEQQTQPHRRKRKKQNAHKPRPRYQTRFGHPEDDLPLLTELGIYPTNILRKALVVLNPLQSISQEVMIDTDLTGPLIFAIALAILLSLHGKIQFSAIYGLCVLGMFLFKFLLSLMHDKSVPLQFIMSALGYALLPNVILAFFRNLQYWVIGSFGRVLMPAAILTILWSSWCATTLLVKGQGMEAQRYLVLYPVILFYAIFAALTIF